MRSATTEIAAARCSARRAGPGQGFLAEVATAWEAAADPARAAGIRVVHPRLGLVLAREGGALAKMLTPFRLGLGGRVGSGDQYWSWVSLDDVTGAIEHAIVTDGLAGPVNVAAPDPPRNRDFVKALGRSLGRPAVFPLPGLAVKVLFGQMGEELLLAGQRVDPGKLAASGYRFAEPELDLALRGALGR